MSEDEWTEEAQIEYDAEREVICDMFPTAKFFICHNLKSLDKAPYGLEDIIDKQGITIKQQFKCYCYTDKPKRDRIFKINCDKMTVKNILTELIKKNCNPDCNHQFFEGFNKNDDGTYGICFGS